MNPRIDAGLRSHPDIVFVNDVPDDVSIRVDPEQLARVLVNLMKNAREALEAHAGARRTARRRRVLRRKAAERLHHLGRRQRPRPAAARPRQSLRRLRGLRARPAARASASPSPASWSRRMAAPCCLPLDPGTRFDITLPAGTLPRLTPAPLAKPGCPVYGWRRFSGACGPATEASAPVAQLDRASDYESGGRTFESFRARQYQQ